MRVFCVKSTPLRVFTLEEIGISSYYIYLCDEDKRSTSIVPGEVGTILRETRGSQCYHRVGFCNRTRRLVLLFEFVSLFLQVQKRAHRYLAVVIKIT